MNLRKVQNIKKITRSEEIQIIFERGQRIRGINFDLLFLKNNLPFSRAGVIVGKKCGGAVDRNYIKRIFREIIYNQKLEFNFPVDLLVVPKAESKKRLFFLLKEEIFSSVQKLVSQYPHLKN